jgi:hypothetical protein
MTRQIHGIEKIATVYGNSSLSSILKEWLGKKMFCILLDDGFMDNVGRK